MVDLLDNYKGVYKTINNASAAIKNGSFGAANPYTPGSSNYNNYSNPGAFGSQKTPAPVNGVVPSANLDRNGMPPGWIYSPQFLAQQARDDAASLANGAANNSANIPWNPANAFAGAKPQTAAPQMNSPVAANSGSSTPVPSPAWNPSNAFGTPTPAPSNPMMVNNSPYHYVPPVAATPSPVTANQQLNGVPPTPTQFQPTPAPVTAAPATPVRTPQQITDYVNQQIAASLGITRSAADQAIASGQTTANQQLGSIQTQYDRNQANVKEDRTLQNVQDDRIYSPYAGNDQGRKSLRDFGRERTDREASQSLTTNLGNVNQNLTDLKNSIEAKQKALVDASPADAEKLKMSLMNDERNYGLNLRAADEKAAQDDFDRQSETFRNNLSAENQRFNQGATTQQMNQQQQNQIASQKLAQQQLELQQKNQSFNQTQATKQQHIDLANLLSQQYGVPVNPTDDPMESYAQVAGLPTVAAKKLAADAQQQGFDNAIKAALADNTITQTQASILNQARQTGISQQNANTSSSNANWSQNPNNPDNQYKLAQLDKLKNGSSDNMKKELDGLYTGLSSGQISGGAAIDEINSKLKAGLLNPSEASQMLALIHSVSSNQPNSPAPKLTQTQIDSSGGNNPQDLNSSQLENLWNTDPSGKAAGRPQMDWSQWYRDPQGKVGGVSYESWHQAYGPQLKAR